MRHKLRVSASVLSENDVKALWCALDADDSNQLTMSEFGGFLKLGDKPQLKKLKPWGSSGHGGETESQVAARNATLACTPTKVIKAELEAAGVSPLDDIQYVAFSKEFNKCAACH